MKRAGCRTVIRPRHQHTCTAAAQVHVALRRQAVNCPTVTAATQTLTGLPNEYDTGSLADLASHKHSGLVSSGPVVCARLCGRVPDLLQGTTPQHTYESWRFV